MGGDAIPHATQTSGLTDTGSGDEGTGMLTVDGGEVTTQPSGSVPGREPVNIDFREIDYEDTAKVDEFCRNGCGCSMNCGMQFSVKHYLLTRSNAQQMYRKELDMALMGQVMAFTFCSQVPQNSTKHRHQLKNREKNSAMYFHNGLRICKKTFLFLHDIGDFRLRAIKAHYLTEGLVPRTHGHSGRTAPNALILKDVKGIITFVICGKKWHSITWSHSRL